MTGPAQAIIQARRAAGLTQAELARRGHTSQPAINRYERGSVRPRPDTLRRLLESCRTQAARPSEALEARRDEVRGRDELREALRRFPRALAAIHRKRALRVRAPGSGPVLALAGGGMTQKNDLHGDMIS